jgi:hypothetical protein
MTKLLKSAFIGIVIASLAGAPAWADRPGYRGGGHRGGHGGVGLDGLAFLLFGTALFLAATAPEPPARPAPVYVPYVPPTPAPPAYVPPPASVAQTDLPPPPAADTQQYWWYYCAQAAAYYPYVKTCPTGWTRVSPTPPGQ